MCLFGKKKQPPTPIGTKCPVEGCSFTYGDPITLKRHTAWKHPELLKASK